MVNFLTFPGGAFRPLEEKDADVIYGWVNDPELRPYFDRTQYEFLSEEQDWIKGLKGRKNNNQVWGVIDDDGALLGTMGIHGINWINSTATTGSMFGDKSKHNKGIGYRAKMVLLKHAFDVLGLRQIYSEVIGFNLRSIAYSQKCGYQIYGKMPNDVMWDTQYYDRVLMYVTREMWLPRWEQFVIEHSIESFSDMLKRHGNAPRP